MIYLIITTCIKNVKQGSRDFESRKKRYFEAIPTVLKLVENDASIKPIIVENNGARPTYLNDFGCDVVYTNNNAYSFPHKGVNEWMDIKYIIEKYNIQDNDTVIKLTGRYKLLSSSFIDTVKRHIDTYDAFVKFFNVCTLQYMWDDCVLGLFAIKCNYIKSLTLRCIRSGECEFAEHVRKNIVADKIMEIKDLCMECCFAIDGRFLIV